MYPEYTLPQYTIPYYEDNTRVSNSAIGWFLNKGPAYFRRMLDGEEQGLDLPQLRKGTMIHEFLLQPEEFWNDYVLFEGEKPKSAQAQKFCENLSNTVELELNKQLSDAYRKSYSIVGKSEDKILAEALKLSVEYKDYIEAIKSRKILISEYDLKTLQAIQHNIGEHKAARKLLRKAMDYGSVHVYHEFQINWEYSDVPCKSLLDSCTFDFDNKVVTIMDLKTTAKLWHFEDSMKEFGYYRQLAFYHRAAEWYLINILGLSLGEVMAWEFKHYIIAIDTVGKNEIRVFGIKTEDLEELEFANISRTLYDIKWHIDNNKWEHSKEYYVGDGIEALNL